MVRRDPYQPATSRGKPGILSSHAPSELFLNVGATHTEVFIGYLQSYYARMGLLEVSCVEGCRCKTVRHSRLAAHRVALARTAPSIVLPSRT